MASSSGSAQVGTSSTTKGGDVSVTISLHPLPILSISEHLTREVSQRHRDRNDDAGPFVYGALLGTQHGREVQVQNSFEIKVASSSTSNATASHTSRAVLKIDQEWLDKRFAQFKQVFPTLDFLGWYGVGVAPSAQDLSIHKQLLEHNESPLFLQLAPTTEALTNAKGRAELPVTVYEALLDFDGSHAMSQPAVTGRPGNRGKTEHAASDDAMDITEGESSSQASNLEVATGEPSIVFVPAKYELRTGEAERIAVDYTSRPAESSSDGSESRLVATLKTQHSAISMLAERIQTVHGYVQGILAGSVTRDEEALRQVKAVLAALPRMDEVEEFMEEYHTEYSDVLLTQYLGSLTQSLHLTNELMDKFDVLQNTSSAATSIGGAGGSGNGLANSKAAQESAALSAGAELQIESPSGEHAGGLFHALPPGKSKGRSLRR
ncbi:COP9 signalosome, subunit CSN6 [Ceraceosorus bombacis]|uniref:COP9 signalosome complex subunit 6 n=1 Tax=Ceraceosorus bombacis TaxID=401625 RepID=A0A0P1BQ47_9BASI|nr:COP9 signalosome, subunit CSN6 [Ceraceosorus bombacis]